MDLGFLSFSIELMDFAVVIVLLLSFPALRSEVKGFNLRSRSVFPCFVICKVFPDNIIG